MATIPRSYASSDCCSRDEQPSADSRTTDKPMPRQKSMTLFLPDARITAAGAYAGHRPIEIWLTEIDSQPAEGSRADLGNPNSNIPSQDTPLASRRDHTGSRKCVLVFDVSACTARPHVRLPGSRRINLEVRDREYVPMVLALLPARRRWRRVGGVQRAGYVERG